MFFKVLLGLTVNAQTQTRFTLQIKNAGIEDLVTSIESQSAYRFFYDRALFDSLKVDINITGQPLNIILDQLFSGTDYAYSFYNGQTVILTKGTQIITELSAQYLPRVQKAKPEKLAVFSDLKDDKPIVPATLENKVYSIGNVTATLEKGTASVAGYIRYSTSGEPASGIAIFTTDPRIGTVTDQFGYYNLNLPKGRHELSIRGMGVKDTRRLIILYSNGKLNINIQEQILSLKEVVITADKASNIKSTQMGVEKLDIKTIKQVPTVFGEADILRVVLTLPGVKSVGESSTGFNVRGGAVDQNLILFNDATIFNPAHFFGFFSAFNPEVIKDVELYKSSIPSKYGGRLSSVLELNTREGNKKTFQGSAGIGLITSRLNLEGPIIKDKTTFILGGRTTYSNWILKTLPKTAGFQNAKAGFYDLNLNLSHQHNAKNNFYFTGYLSNDDSNLASDISYAYQNKNISLKWKHLFSNKLNSIVTSGIDLYDYENYSDANKFTAYQLKFGIKQNYLKTDFNYYLNSKHTLDFGASTIKYNLQPGNYSRFSPSSLVIPKTLQTEQALESAVYVTDRFELSPAISFNMGLRYSLFNSMGPSRVKSYYPNGVKEEGTVSDVSNFSKGDIIKTYHGPEFRFSGRLALSSDWSVKASFNTLRQYIHMLSNTASMSPTDIWKLSDMNIKPQNGDQFSLGLYKNLKSNTIETSVEGYYKRLNNYLDYKSGAVLILNENIEQDVINTNGKAYGIEFLIKKLTGKINGWVGYSYSRTLLKTDDRNNDETINSGKYFPANHDKPHDFTLISNYRFSHRVSMSFNATYSTGRPITLPIARFSYLNSQRVLYTDRNQYRIPNYFRTDISMNIEGNHKLKQLTHNSWTFGIYNLTARKNAFSSYFVTENGVIRAYKLSIFSTAIPFINYNIRF
jgi:hypothetical protein